MREREAFHSIGIQEQKCIGCVSCMKACPTKAIRVHNRKARIIYERCIDCGECLRVCAHGAVVPITTSPSDLTRFKHRIAIPSPVLYTQFGQHVMPNEILVALKETGFDNVYDEALACEMTSLAVESYLDDNKSPGPIISSTCPVVVRLIQRLFPDLCPLIIPIEPPRETAAKNLRRETAKEYGIAEESIGIIHITPCSAKMVSINRPETLAHSFLDGAIPIHDVFNSIMLKLKKRERRIMLQTQTSISGIGIGWAMAGGEIKGMKYYHSVSVSGVRDTIKILEDVESGRLKDIQYLECLICPDGCIGGPLTVENRFVAKSNLLRLIRIFGDKRKVDEHSVKRLYGEKFFSFERAVSPRPFTPLDKDKNEAIRKLKLKERIVKRLPGKDCGVCGAPDCRTLADDYARGEASLKDCIFLETQLN